MYLCAATPGFPESIKMKQKVVANITLAVTLMFRLLFWVLITTWASTSIRWGCSAALSTALKFVSCAWGRHAPSVSSLTKWRKSIFYSEASLVVKDVWGLGTSVVSLLQRPCPMIDVFISKTLHFVPPGQCFLVSITYHFYSCAVTWQKYCKGDIWVWVCVCACVSRHACVLSNY